MPTAAHALQQAIFATLAADNALLTALGGAKIYDDAPQAVAHPYVTFGQSQLRDWSTGTDPGDEHVVTLHVWSAVRGKREADAIAGLIRSALHDQPLTLDGHRLINLRHEFSDTRREPATDAYHGLVRLRAVTEPM